MKQVIFGIILIILNASGALAQQWTTSGSNIYNSNTGNVGIGTTAPGSRLSVTGGRLSVFKGIEFSYADPSSTDFVVSNSAANSRFLIGQNANNYGGMTWNYNANPANAYLALGVNISGTLAGLNINNVGNVGIGTTAPFQKLSVAISSASTTVSDANIINIYNSNTTDNNISGIWFGGATTNLNVQGAGILGIQTSHTAGARAADLALYTTTSNASTEKIRILGNGSVGIGTSTPQAKLDVAGNIYSNGKIYIGTPDANTAVNMGANLLAVDGSAVFEKVTVKATLWPDYVFKKEYELPSLQETESYIQTHQHLPGVPSAAEVEKDGIDVGANQAALLQKIEELTLIVIEQNKRIEKLEKENNDKNQTQLNNL